MPSGPGSKLRKCPLTKHTQGTTCFRPSTQVNWFQVVCLGFEIVVALDFSPKPGNPGECYLFETKIRLKRLKTSGLTVLQGYSKKITKQ